MAIALFLGACFLTNCSKNSVMPLNKPVTTSTGGTGSTAATDTLPNFYSPAGIAVDLTGNIYVSDYGNNLIRKITAAGVVSTFAGNGVEGQTNGAAALSSFNQPKGIAVDQSGNVFIADAGNNLIRKITPGGLVSTVAGIDSAGAVNGPAASASFFGPAGVAIDASGNLYVADAGNNLVRTISPQGVVATLAGSSNGTVFANPTGIAVDASGNVYVANYLDNNILTVNSTGVVSTLAGSGQSGALNGAGSTATFFFPNSVALDAANNIYVADGVNNLIRKITPAGVVSTFAGSGLSGAADSTGTAASFNGPSGLAVDSKGNVYVADSNNNLIRKITPAGVVSTVAGTGAAGAKNGIAVLHRNRILTVKSSAELLNIWSSPVSRPQNIFR